MLSFNKRLRSVGALGTLLAIASAVQAAPLAPPSKANPQTVAKARQMMASRHAHFVENRGQWGGDARYFAQGKGVDVWYTGRGLRFDQHFHKNGKFVGQAVDMTFVGGKAFRPEGQRPRRSVQAVFRGKTSIPEIRSFEETYARDVLPGVDLRGYYSQTTPRYDLIVKPGVDPQSVKMAFRGANGLSLASGALKIGTKGGGFLNSKPLAYQMVDGARRPVNARWAIRDSRTAGFEIGAYDRSKPLVIDPLVFGTYYGGDQGMDEVRSAVGDGSSVIIVGTTDAPDFPALYGPYNNSFNQNNQDAFIARLTNNGSDQDYAALIGGSGIDIAQYVKLDGDGNVWIAGTTDSRGQQNDYPATTLYNGPGATTKSIFITEFLRVPGAGLGTPPLTPVSLSNNAFFQSLVLGLDDSMRPTTGDKDMTGFDLQPGSRGGNIGFAISGVTDDALEPAILPNEPNTTNRPASRLNGHYFEGHRQGFLLRFYANATTGDFYGIGNPAINQYVEGIDANETRGVALDELGNAYLVGTVYQVSPRNVDTGVIGNEAYFETTPLVFQGVDKFYVTGRVLKSTDVFVRKYSPLGNFRPTQGDPASNTCFSGLIGGVGTDEAGGVSTTPFVDLPALFNQNVVRLAKVYTGSAIAVGPGGDIFLTGTFAGSFDFPVTRGAFQSNITLNANVFVAKLDNAGRQIKAATGLAVSAQGAPDPIGSYSPWSPLTISPSGIAVDSRGLVYVTGNVRPLQIDFPPMTPGDPNEPTAVSYSSIYFPADAAAKAAFITALSVEDQTYDSPAAPEFPTTESFLTGLDSDLTTLTAQTYIGGQDDDFCYTPSIDPITNEVLVVGWTDGNRFYRRVNAAGTTIKDYISPFGRRTGLPSGNAAPTTDNLLTLPRVKVNSALVTFTREVIGYGIWANTGKTDPTTNLVEPEFVGVSVGRDGYVLRLSAVGTQAPTRVVNLAFNPTSVPSGSTVTGTITLSSPAPTGGTTVQVSTTSSSVYVSGNPFSVTVPAGLTTATFTVTAANVPTDTQVAFTAKASRIDNGVTASFTIKALAYTLSFSPTSVIADGTSTVTGTVKLPNTTPTDIRFNLVSEDANLAAVPSSVTIPAGSSQVDFTFTPRAIVGTTPRTLSFSAKVASAPLTTVAPAYATLTLRPVPPPTPVALASIVGSRNPVKSSAGGQITYTITFNGAVTSATTVAITFSSPSVVTGPSTVTVPAGARSVTATYTVNRVSRPIDVMVTASGNSSQVTTTTTFLR